MDVNFNYRANNRFVVRCVKHGEVDRCASRTAAKVRAESFGATSKHFDKAVAALAGSIVCGPSKGCTYTVEDSIK